MFWNRFSSTLRWADQTVKSQANLKGGRLQICFVPFQLACLFGFIFKYVPLKLWAYVQKFKKD